MTNANKTERAIDALKWIQDNARCIETRRFVSKVLRELEPTRHNDDHDIEKTLSSH